MICETVVSSKCTLQSLHTAVTAMTSGLLKFSAKHFDWHHLLYTQILKISYTRTLTGDNREVLDLMLRNILSVKVIVVTDN